MDRHYGRACKYLHCLVVERRVKTLRNRLDRHNLTEATRDMVKKSTDDVKNLASFPTGRPHVGLPTTSCYQRSVSQES